MLTRAQLEQMTDAERLETFDRFLSQLYGGTGLLANRALAADFRIHEQTPYKWRAKPDSLPWAMLYALSAMAESEAEARAQLARQMRDDLVAVADLFAATADRLSSLALLAQNAAPGNLPSPVSPPPSEE